MTFTAPPARNADLLTRTTLQFDASMSTPSIARVIHALQRVPGVLLAEVNTANARAIVAHDAAVPNASLLAAAAGAGAQAQIVADTRAPAISVNNPAAPFQHVRMRQLVTLATAAFVTLTVVDVLVPKAADKHWVLAVYFSALWVFFFAQAIARRRP